MAKRKRSSVYRHQEIIIDYPVEKKKGKKSRHLAGRNKIGCQQVRRETDKQK